MMTIEQAKDKLMKLLALAASDNENEASLAMDRARDLMRKYSLTTLDVAADGSGAHVKRFDIAGLTKSYAPWEQHLASAIVRTFNGRLVSTKDDMFYENGQFRYRLCFFAGKSDSEIIADMFLRLRSTIERMANKYAREQRKLYGYTPRRAKVDYRIGVVRTVRERLRAIQDNATDTTNAAGLTGKDLIVVKEKAVNQRVERDFTHLRKSAGMVARNADAYYRGKADGHNVNLHRSVRGNGGAALRLGA